ncbi:MAG: hypothetical protein ACRDRA_04630 [Pseudonocardiaceae bacterium]
MAESPGVVAARKDMQVRDLVRDAAVSLTAQQRDALADLLGEVSVGSEVVAQLAADCPGDEAVQRCAELRSWHRASAAYARLLAGSAS